jgi:hypothetical protein
VRLHLLQAVSLDKDGDVIIPRRKKTRRELSILKPVLSTGADDGAQNYECFAIEHSMATPLKLVGLQIWSGAFLLVDYLIQHQVIMLCNFDVHQEL